MVFLNEIIQEFYSRVTEPTQRNKLKTLLLELEQLIISEEFKQKYDFKLIVEEFF